MSRHKLEIEAEIDDAALEAHLAEEDHGPPYALPDEWDYLSDITAAVDEEIIVDASGAPITGWSEVEDPEV